MQIKELKIREERHFLKEQGTAKLNVEFYMELIQNQSKFSSQMPFELILIL